MGIIIVDEVPYKTKIALKRKLKSIRAEMCETNCTTISPTSKYFPFWASLFKRNPYKGHYTPTSFRFEKPYHMYFTTKSGYEDSFGYNFCIDQIPSSKKSDLNQCLRSTIEPQILAFGNKTRCTPCAICLELSDRHEIDHVIPFKKLCIDFQKTERNIDMELFKVKNDKDKHRLIFDLSDAYTKSLHDHWYEYHENVAELQKLCIACHKNKTRKR